MPKKTKLKLLYGGKARYAAVKGVKVSVVPSTLHPLPVDVRVFEEDTHLILTVDPVMRFSEEHPIRLMNDLKDAKRREPGKVVINNNSWYAVVHNLDAEPTCCREWIGQCYREIFRLAEQYGITALGLPLLGSVHGNVKSADTLAALLESLRAMHTIQLRKLRHVMVLEFPVRIEATRKKLFKLVQ